MCLSDVVFRKKKRKQGKINTYITEELPRRILAESCSRSNKRSRQKNPVVTHSGRPTNNGVYGRPTNRHAADRRSMAIHTLILFSDAVKTSLWRLNPTRRSTTDPVVHQL